MVQFSKASTQGLGMAGILGKWLDLTLRRLPYILTLIIVGVGLVRIVRMRIKGGHSIAVESVMLALFGLVLFLGFFFSIWNGKPRYFAPAFVVLSAALLMLGADLEGSVRKRLMLPLVYACIAHLIIVLVVLSGKHKFETMSRIPPTEPRPCVQILDTANAYFRGDIDFVGSSTGRDNAEMLAKKWQLVLCDG